MTILRHACMSTLPTASICEYCSSAFVWISMLLPPANTALFNASDKSVASDKLRVSGANFWVTPAKASTLVGRPMSLSLIFSIAARASAAEYPMFFICLGNCDRMSARLMPAFKPAASVPPTAAKATAAVLPTARNAPPILLSIVLAHASAWGVTFRPLSSLLSAWRKRRRNVNPSGP